MTINVPKADFLIIVRAWRDMVHESYDDLRTCAMMGAIQKNIPEFFEWLEAQKSFKKIQEVKLRDFISTMKRISKLGEGSLTLLIRELEKNDKKPGKKEEVSTEDKESVDPDHNSGV